MPAKQQMIDEFYRYINSRPGFDPADYGDSESAYRSDQRVAMKDKHHAFALLRAVENDDDITADDLLEALKQGFSGRLSWDEKGGKLTYCTGQYYPTEFRAAAAAVLSYALRRQWRKEDVGCRDSAIYKRAHLRFGVSIARSWFQ